VGLFAEWVRKQVAERRREYLAEGHSLTEWHETTAKFFSDMRGGTENDDIAKVRRKFLADGHSWTEWQELIDTIEKSVQGAGFSDA